MHAHGENTALPDGTAHAPPYQKPLRTWASRGTGAPCDLCGGRIHATGTEYQIEVALTGDARMLHMHFDCHRRWAIEGRRRER
jgi:hypothetical protein